MQLKIASAVTVTLLLGAAFGYGLLDQPLSGLGSTWSPPAEARASGATARTRVSALGRLEPRSEVIDVSGATGTRVLRLMTRDGAEVRAGQALALLDEHPERLAARDRAAVRLAEARALKSAEIAYRRAEIEKAEARLARTEQLVPLEIQVQETEVQRLEADLDHARRSLDRLSRLHSRKQTTDQALDDQNAIVTRLEQQLAGARLALARLRAMHELAVLEAQAELRSATAELERARISVKEDTLAADLALAEAEVEHVIVRSPIAGEVLKILTRPGERIGAQPILKMGTTSQMYAVAEVDETDVRFVRPSQRAVVTSPALPEPLRGTVEHVSRLVFKNDILDVDPGARVDARVVEVRVRLDESDFAASFNHLQVRVTIELDARAEQ